MNHPSSFRSWTDENQDRPDVLKGILSKMKIPLKDAAAVNATRRVLYRELQRHGILRE